jgi:uracil-DNA glycosylase
MQMFEPVPAQPLPDLLAQDLRVVFCGLNPGVAAAAAGHHFLGRGNRFWPVLHLAGFTPHQLAPGVDGCRRAGNPRRRRRRGRGIRAGGTGPAA